jgi:hypothetical protein
MRELCARVVLGAAMIGLAGCPPPPVVDVPAAQLVIQPTILDVEPSPPDGKVPVIVTFQQAGKPVQLGGASSVACNGVALTWNGLGYAARVPIVAAGGDVAITHAHGGVNTPVHVTVPARPQLTSPAPGATVARTTSLTITYVAAGAAGVTPGAGDSATAMSGAEQPDTGTATLDVSKLKAGAGTVSVWRRVVASPSGTGFASVVTTYNISSADVRLTWQ